MDAPSIIRPAGVRLLRYLQPGDQVDVAPAQRVADKLHVPLAYLLADSDLLAQMVLAFGLLSERQQRKALGVIKRELFPSNA